MHYSIDYDDLEKKAADSRNKMLLLCNPHNPVGRVWSREELQRVADICNRNHVLVVSDEIHADLIMPGFCHTAYAALSDEAAQNCIICTAPSKTFNLAGLCISNIIIPNESIRKTYNDYLMHNNLGGAVNALGFKACETAYTKCGAWLDECISVIEANHKLCEAFMKKNMNEVKVFPLEGTYLQWLDFRAWGLKPEELEKFMTEKAYWFTDEGYSFGEEGSGFERLNLACPTAVLQEALERLCAGTKP
jgi:aminotransferase/cystathionine beta-lyase